MISAPVSGPARESETVSLMMTAETLCYPSVETSVSAVVVFGIIDPCVPGV